VPARAVRNARPGIRADRASLSRVSSVSAPAALIFGADARTCGRAAASAAAQPLLTRLVASAVRANPPISAAAPARCARSASTSRACG